VCIYRELNRFTDEGMDKDVVFLDSCHGGPVISSLLSKNTKKYGLVCAKDNGHLNPISWPKEDRVLLVVQIHNVFLANA
jgi:hypothetical protein